MHLTERINCREEAFNTLNGLLIRMLNSCEFLFICRLQTLSNINRTKNM